MTTPSMEADNCLSLLHLMAPTGFYADAYCLRGQPVTLLPSLFDSSQTLGSPPKDLGESRPTLVIVSYHCEKDFLEGFHKVLIRNIVTL